MAKDSVPPNPFPDPDADDLTIEVTDTLPGSVGGPTEAVKRAMMVALRETLTGTSLTANSLPIKVSMEYPMTQAMNPGIWVQFAFTNVDRAGIGHDIPAKINGRWVSVQEWIYYGRVTLTIVAYTSIERDRISDAFFNNLAFARGPDLVITKPTQDTKLFRALIDSINKNPYVFLTPNTDSIQPGGPGMSIGTPWDDFQKVYEDTWSFDVVGQVTATTDDGIYELRDVVETQELDEEPPEDGWTAWM